MEIGKVGVEQGPEDTGLEMVAFNLGLGRKWVRQ